MTGRFWSAAVPRRFLVVAMVRRDHPAPMQSPPTFGWRQRRSISHEPVITVQATSGGVGDGDGFAVTIAGRAEREPCASEAGTVVPIARLRSFVASS